MNPENQKPPDEPLSAIPSDKKNKVSVKLLKKEFYFSKFQLGIFIVIFGLIGAFVFYMSFAASLPKPNMYSGNLSPAASTHSDDQLLVSFNAGTAPKEQQALLNRYGAKVKQDMPQIDTKVITVPPEAIDAVQAALSHNPAVRFAENDQQAVKFDTTPNDYWWPNEWSQVKTQANKVWDSNQGSSLTIVAILDTGADPSPPDLQGAYVPGWNTLNNNSDTSDSDGHGTMTAGVALARGNNTIGIASYCWKCSLMPVKVIDTGAGSVASVSSGITWAADHGAKVISMSLGFTASSSTLSNAVSYARSKGALVIAAAGNYGTNSPVYPAATPGAIGIAGSDGNDALYSWSSYGPWVKASAPGCNFATDKGGGYGTFCGTSSAAPAAAGIAGLLFSISPTPSLAQVEQAFTGGSDTCCGGQIGGGRINAYKALQSLSGISPAPADTTAPTASISSPTAASTVSGQSTISVNASDNTSVAKVELYIDNGLYATSSASPYSFYWDTTKVSNGSHTILAKAYDAAGNVGSSSLITVTVSNTSDTAAPTVSLSAPANGASIAGQKRVSVSATATDNNAVTSMEIYIDGVLKTSSTSGSINYSWSVNKQVKAGSHTITVKAYDAAGNIGQNSVSVTK